MKRSLKTWQVYKEPYKLKPLRQLRRLSAGQDRFYKCGYKVLLGG